MELRGAALAIGLARLHGLAKTRGCALPIGIAALPSLACDCAHQASGVDMANRVVGGVGHPSAALAIQRYAVRKVKTRRRA